MKTKKAFSLIEVLAGLFILSLIVLFMLPSLYNTNKLRKKMLEEDELLYQTMECIERDKTRAEQLTTGTTEENGIRIERTVTDYEDFILLHIRTTKGKKEYEFETLIQK